MRNGKSLLPRKRDYSDAILEGRHYSANTSLVFNRWRASIVLILL